MSCRPIAPVQSVEPTRLKFTAMWNEFRFLSFTGKQHKSLSMSCEWGHLISSQTQIYPHPAPNPTSTISNLGICTEPVWPLLCVIVWVSWKLLPPIATSEFWNCDRVFFFFFIFLFHYPALVSQIPKITCNTCCVGIFVYTVEYSLVVWSQIIKIVL